VRDCVQTGVCALSKGGERLRRRVKKVLLTILTAALLSLCSCALVLLCSWTYLFAQEEVLELGEVVVTATRTEKEVKDVPASVTIIQPEEISASSSSDNVTDLVKSAVGVDSQNMGGLASLIVPTSLNLRGLWGPSSTLLLVDGEPLNDGLNGLMNLNLIPRESIKRIEVIRGPFSALYGSFALGGVVNLITKEGDEEEKVSGGIDLGSYEYRSIRLTKSDKLKRSTYHLAFERRSTDNYLARDNQVNRDYEEDRLRFKTNFNLKDDANLSLSSSYFKGEGGFGLTSKNQEKEMKKEDFQSSLLYRNRRERVDYKANLSFHLLGLKNYSESVDPTALPSPPTYVPSLMSCHSDDTTLSLLASLPLGEKNFLTLGIENSWNHGKWDLKNLETNQPLSSKLNKEVRTFAFYLQDEINLSDKVLFILGSRLDYHSQFGSQLSPKVSFSYRLSPNSSLYSSWGRAFRAPTLGELYSPEWMRAPGTPYKGNPELKPEKVTAYELGLKKKFSKKMEGRLSLFRNKGKELIIFESPQNKNIGRAKMEGVEAEINFKLSKSTQGFLNYTYLEAVDEVSGQVLEYSPHNKANLGLRFKGSPSSLVGRHLGPISCSLSSRYLSKRYYLYYQQGPPVTKQLPGYVTFDLNFEFELSPQLKLFSSIKNLTNKKYQEYGGYDAGGRTYLIGLRSNR